MDDIENHTENTKSFSIAANRSSKIIEVLGTIDDDITESFMAIVYNDYQLPDIQELPDLIDIFRNTYEIGTLLEWLFVNFFLTLIISKSTSQIP